MTNGSTCPKCGEQGRKADDGSLDTTRYTMECPKGHRFESNQ